jgi:predicted polyphosphate/ATP-dependent NAD kinase
MFKLGLIVNPIAGLGGPAGLKGSDELSRELKSQAHRAPQRAQRALEQLSNTDALEIFCYPGEMGELEARAAGFHPKVLPADLIPGDTSAADTMAAAKQLVAEGVDLILFAGGDGTARNIYDAIGCGPAVLGIPAGVKMHSGVYAVSPESAGEVLKLLIHHDLVSIAACEVRDIDEAAFRKNLVKARYYGEMMVPEAGHYVQAVKNGGREVEALVLDDIAADVIENMDAETMYIVAPGSTTAAVMEQLDLPNTLLGVDVVLDKTLVAADVNALQLETLLSNHSGSVVIVLTAIGGQGHILGRGNQQMSPAVIRRVGRENLRVIATKTKIAELEGRPLLVDTNDPELDRSLSGFISVITGYRDAIMYPIAGGESQT